MVTHSGAPVRTDRLRPLSVPRPLHVDADGRGWPVAVGIGGWGLGVRGDESRGVPVLEILDRWRIDDEWWRKEISRMYFQVLLAPEEAPLAMTIFHDLIEGSWFAQTTATPLQQAEPLHVLTPRTSVVGAGRRGEKRVSGRRAGVA